MFLKIYGFLVYVSLDLWIVGIVSVCLWVAGICFCMSVGCWYMFLYVCGLLVYVSVGLWVVGLCFCRSVACWHSCYMSVGCWHSFCMSVGLTHKLAVVCTSCRFYS